MTGSISKFFIGSAFIFLFVLLSPVAIAASGDYLSPVDLVASLDGKTLYIAQATAKQVVFYDLDDNKVTKVISLPDAPTGLTLSPDGKYLYVTDSSPQGKFHTVDLKNGAITSRMSVGHTPCSPVITAKGDIAYICNRFNNNVSVIDLATNNEVVKIGVTREPIAAALTKDGKFLFVANHLPAGAGDREYTSANVNIINTENNKVTATIQLPNGSTSLRGICLSPDGKYVYITHILARYLVLTTQLDRGWMNTNAMSILDVAEKKWLNTVLLDDVDLGAANPWGVSCTDDGKYIIVTLAGTHEIAVIDAKKLHDKLARVAKGEKVSDVSSSPENVPNDLSFLVGIKRRIKLQGNGPRGLAVIGSNVYVAEYFTDTIGTVDINPQVRDFAQSLSLGPKVEMDAVRKGEMFFNDASHCFQKWQSCASCHPDVRADGLNWDLLNDGIGNPKQVKSMLLAHKTPPAMSTGIRANAEVAVRAGLKYIQFSVRPEEDAVAIDEFLKSLKPVPSPYLVNGKLSKAAERGEKLFIEAGCAHCHSGPYLSNMKQYDLGTGKNLDKGRKFDVPTLIEIWRTAPYLHDGRAANMEDVLTIHNVEDRHGTTSNLTPEELENLVEYIMSL